MFSLLWSFRSAVDHEVVRSALNLVDRWWDWRISAYWRAGSLVSLWAVVLLMGPLGWLFMPLTVIRSVLSFAQTGLNVRLGRAVPLEKQTRFDWALVGGVFAGAYLAAGVSHFTGSGITAPLLVPMLLPFSLLQVRMTARSLNAATIAELRPAALIRLEEHSRPERGELRAA